jgi:hypothetical protein
MNSKQTLNKVKTLLGLEVKLEQMKLDNGVILEAEVFEAGNEIFIVNEEDRVALPVGEYVLENGMILIVSEEGIIGEIKEASVEEEAPVEEVVEEQEMSTEENAQPKKVVESVSKEMFFSEIENLKKEIEALKAEKQELSKDEVKEEVKEVELSEQTQENEPLKHNPEATAENKQQFLFAQKRVLTTKDRVFNKLFK